MCPPQCSFDLVVIQDLKSSAAKCLIDRGLYLKHLLELFPIYNICSVLGRPALVIHDLNSADSSLSLAFPLPLLMCPTPDIASVANFC